MEVLALIVHRGIGLVDVSLHPNEPHMWKQFAERILQEDEEDFQLVRQANPQLSQLNPEEHWDQLCKAWNDYWDGEKYTDFQIFNLDLAEFTEKSENQC